MYIYNLTVKVDKDIEDEWIQWQKEIHIPEVMGTGLFYEHHFFQLLEQDESEGKTFVVQFFANIFDDYKKYIQLYASGLRNKTMGKWGNQFIAFPTLLQSVK